MTKKILYWIILLLIIILPLEFISYHLYHKYYGYSPIDNPPPELVKIYKKYNVDYQELVKENDYLYYGRGCIYHPYRWYMLEKNYNGRYIKLDKYGFRISRQSINENAAKIACFGGSTMYSISTADDGTIPYFLNKKLNNDTAIALNYGIGGYSSSAELTTLIEVKRYDKNIKYAIFYDGVNEIGRYIEYLQMGPESPVFNYMGYPFYWTEKYSLLKYLKIPPPGSGYRPYLYKFIKKQVDKITAGRSPKKILIKDYDKAADTIVGIYVNNVKDINTICQASNITPIFILQPTIYLTNMEKLTPREKYIAKHTYSDVDITRLYKLVYQKIRNNEFLQKMIFSDLSGALNNSPSEEHFYDDCHLFNNGNEIVANKLYNVLTKYVPQNYIKN